jgi:serine/threonine protein kinase
VARRVTSSSFLIALLERCHLPDVIPFMSPDEFVLALRALDAPVFLDDHGVSGPLGVEFTATTSDGRSVLVTQLSPALNRRVTNPDAFVRTIEHAGYQGAGVTESGQLYFLELPLRGTSIAHRLAASGPIPASEVLDLARAVCDVLTAPDVAPHGLLTPSTVVVDDAGRVTLRWPQMWYALREAGIDPVTLGRELGATEYLAPELLRGAAADMHSDVFALGTTLYAALTGRPPFGGRTTATTMAVVLADGGAPATTATGTLTAALVRAIEQDPADRWHDLQQFRAAIGGDAQPRSAATSRQAARSRSGCATRAAILVGIGALVLWAASRYI